MCVCVHACVRARARARARVCVCVCVCAVRVCVRDGFMLKLYRILSLGFHRLRTMPDLLLSVQRVELWYYIRGSRVIKYLFFFFFIKKKNHPQLFTCAAYRRAPSRQLTTVSGQAARKGIPDVTSKLPAWFRPHNL